MAKLYLLLVVLFYLVSHILAASQPTDLTHSTQNEMLFQYHNGPLLSGKISVNLIWYGKFTPTQRAIITDFITSLSSSSSSKTAQPSVATWWKGTHKYYNLLRHHSSSSLSLTMGAHISDQRYSLGKSLTSRQILQLASRGGQSYAVNVVLTSDDVAVDGFCRSRCGTHGFSSNVAHLRHISFSFISKTLLSSLNHPNSKQPSSMADNEALSNGVNGDTADLNEPDHSSQKSTSTPSIDDLNQRIEALEKEKSDLETEKSKSEAKIGDLQAQIESLKAENAESESNRRAAESIAKRASELEIQVSRLEHDYITSMNEGAESSREAQELKTKIKEIEEKAKREKQAKENEIAALLIEKKEVENSVEQLQASLRISEAKVNQLEEKLDDLAKKSDESEKLIDGLMDKVAEREVSDDGFAGFKNLLPAIGAVSAGVIVAAAVVCYIRQK